MTTRAHAQHLRAVAAEILATQYEASHVDHAAELQQEAAEIDHLLDMGAPDDGDDFYIDMGDGEECLQPGYGSA